MRPGIDSTWTAALAAKGIATGILGWFDFADGAVGIWTGTQAIMPTGTGDTLLDGQTFQPLSNGNLVQVGDNAFSYTGSSAMTVSLAIPSAPTTAMLLSAADPAEYQTRTAVLWRTLMITPPDSSTPAAWAFRRVRAGAMDELSITHDGQKHLFSLTIEAHASMISGISGSTYLDQKTRYDPNDTSQDFAVSIANNPANPASTTLGGALGGGGSAINVGAPGTIGGTGMGMRMVGNN